MKRRQDPKITSLQHSIINLQIISEQQSYSVTDTLRTELFLNLHLHTVHVRMIFLFFEAPIYLSALCPSSASWHSAVVLFYLRKFQDFLRTLLIWTVELCHIEVCLMKGEGTARINSLRVSQGETAGQTNHGFWVSNRNTESSSKDLCTASILSTIFIYIVFRGFVIKTKWLCAITKE